MKNIYALGIQILLALFLSSLIIIILGASPIEVFKNIFNDFSITPYVFIDKDNSSFNQVINLISEYVKYNLAFVRINLL